MKRDMDLIREILLAINESEETETLSLKNLGVKNRSWKTLILHLELLGDAGLILCDMDESISDSSDPEIYRITWAGYEFLEAANDDKRWEQAKKIAGKVGSGSFEILKSVLTGLAVEGVRALVPVIRF